MKLTDHEKSFLQRVNAGLKDIDGPEYAVAQRLIWLGLIEGMDSRFLNSGPSYSCITLTNLGHAHVKP